MNLIKPSVEILDEVNGIAVLKKIELAGRTCYKSEDKITDESCKAFVANLIKRGHEAMLEHYNLTFKVICDRGVTHEIVRHRIASYAQESTRYVNYNKKGMSFIEVPFWQDENNVSDVYKHTLWLNHLKSCEDVYNKLIEAGAKPEEARAVLPNSLKTEIVVTMNMREIRHFLKLRTSPYAHPQMREIAFDLLRQLKDKVPVLFDDINA